MEDISKIQVDGVDYNIKDADTSADLAQLSANTLKSNLHDGVESLRGDIFIGSNTCIAKDFSGHSAPSFDSGRGVFIGPAVYIGKGIGEITKPDDIDAVILAQGVNISTRLVVKAESNAIKLRVGLQSYTQEVSLGTCVWLGHGVTIRHDNDDDRGFLLGNPHMDQVFLGPGVSIGTNIHMEPFDDHVRIKFDDKYVDLPWGN